MILEMLPAVQGLNCNDKLRLAYELWDEVSANEAMLTPAVESLLSERLAAYDANPDAVLTMEQAAERMERFKERIARKQSGGHV